MSRVTAVIALGLSLSACNSSVMQSMPSLPDLSSAFEPLFGPRQIMVKVETKPMGAEATSSLGGSCRTPCALSIKPTGDFVVNFALEGYEAQAVPVKVLPPEDPRIGSESTRGARLDPEQVFAELRPVAPARRTGSQPRR